MPESPEHLFLKSEFNNVLESFSKLKLYGFTETGRKKFDLSCLLERDLSRPLAGQVLWKNNQGIDKDIRTLLTDRHSEIKVYITNDTIRNRVTFEEIISDFRSTGLLSDVFRFKQFWIPPDFDADKEQQRKLITNTIKSQIVDDLLFNIIFGKISSEDVTFFLNTTGTIGLNLAVLHYIATQGFFNITSLSKNLDVSSSPIREKLLILSGAGFISSEIGKSQYQITSKGKVFLDIIIRVFKEYQSSRISEELHYILTRLNCKPVAKKQVEACEDVFPSSLFVNLIRTINYAKDYWEIDFSTIDYLNKNDL